MKKIEQFINQITRKNIKNFVFIGILGVSQCILVLYNVNIVKSIVNKGILANDRKTLYHYFILSLFNLTLIGILNFKKKELGLKNNLYLLYRTRIFFLKKFSRLKYSKIANQDTSLLIQRVNEDSRYIFGFYISGLDTAVSLLYFILGLFFLLKIDIKTALLVAIIISIYGVLVVKYNQKYKIKLKIYLLEQDRAFKKLTESLTNIELLRIFNKRSFFSMRYSNQYRKFKDSNQNRMTYNYIYFEFFSFIKQSFPLIIYLVGGILVLNKKLPFGTVVATIMYINLIFMSTDRLIEFNEHLQTYLSSKKRLAEILNIDIYVEPTRDRSLENPKGLSSIEFKNLSYKNILKDINFKIKRGEIILISGVNGAGKSLLMKIICGLLEADSGEILVDEKQITPAEYKNLRNLSTYIDSKSNFFEGSLRENLSIAEEEIENDIIFQLLDILNLSSKIMDFDNILNKNLSLGQLQKLRIIRGLIGRNPIFCCDEIFSNLDKTSKDKLISYLLEQKDKLIFLVTHDKESEKIFKDNRVIELALIKKLDR